MARNGRWHAPGVTDILKSVQNIRTLRVAMLLAAACAAGERAYPQAAEPPAQVVQLSVVALDSHGQPVGDLTAADFEIADAGKPQKVAIFRHGDVKLRQAPPLGAGEFSNRGAANLDHATLILFDLLNQTFGARGEASSYLVDGLKSVESGDSLFLYLLTADAKLYPVRPLPGAGTEAPAPGGVSWTRNAKPLVDGAMTRMFRLRPTSIDMGTRVSLTYAALESVGRMLAGIPGRKSIVWITRGVPISLSVSSQSTVTAGQAVTAGEPLDYAPVLRRLCLILDRLNVAVYPVMQTPPGMGGADDVSSFAVSSEEGLRQIAEWTGGPAKAANTIPSTLRQAINDVRTSYRLGYYPPAANWDGKFHNLRVSCARKGVRLQVQTGYYAIPDKAGDEDEALKVAAATAFDASEIGLRCAMTPSPSGGTVVRFKLGIDPADIRIAQQGDRYSSSLDMQMVGYLTSGEFQSSPVRPLNLSWTADELAKAKTDGFLWNPPIDINVRDTAEKVRFLVFDRDSHAIGTLTIPLKTAK
jgi:VWFA-related protein